MLNKMVIDMLALLPKTSARAYGTVVGLSPGRAAVTDGFALLIFNDPSIVADGTVKTDLQPSAVKFPAYDSIVPSLDTSSRVNSDTWELLKLRLSKNPDVGIIVTPGETPRVQVRPEQEFFSLHVGEKYRKFIDRHFAGEVAVYLSADGQRLMVHAGPFVYVQAARVPNDKQRAA